MALARIVSALSIAFLFGGRANADCIYIPQIDVIEAQIGGISKNIQAGNCSKYQTYRALISEEHRLFLSKRSSTCNVGSLPPLGPGEFFSVGTYDMNTQVGPSRLNIKDYCATKQGFLKSDRLNHPTGSERAQTARTQKIVATNVPRPAKSPRATELVSPTASIDCGSDISGTGGPTASVQSCIAQSSWTPSQPYNHAQSPMTFRTFRGPPVKVRKGESLWSVPDADNPTGRHLEARNWNGSSDMSGLCAQEGTSATVKPFIVNLSCETDRQAILEQDFEAREEHFPYKDRCPPNWTERSNAGWQTRPLSYWQDHPGEPVGWCDSPMKNGRQDELKLRDPNWRTAQECNDDPHGPAPTVNSRGVRGCPAQNP